MEHSGTLAGSSSTTGGDWQYHPPVQIDTGEQPGSLDALVSTVAPDDISAPVLETL